MRLWVWGEALAQGEGLGGAAPSREALLVAGRWWGRSGWRGTASGVSPARGVRVVEALADGGEPAGCGGGVCVRLSGRVGRVVGLGCWGGSRLGRHRSGCRRRLPLSPVTTPGLADPLAAQRRGGGHPRPSFLEGALAFLWSCAPPRPRWPITLNPTRPTPGRSLP